MGRRPPPPGEIDYHFDPDAHKKTTYAWKQREARKADVLEVEQKQYQMYVRIYYGMTAVGFILIIIALSTIGWFYAYQEQETLNSNQDILLRQIEYRMSCEGLQFYIEYCPEIIEGVTEGDTSCVTEQDAYEPFSKVAHWSTVKGKISNSDYSQAAADAAEASSNMLAIQVVNLLVCIGVASVMTYGLYRKPHRRMCLCAMFILVVSGALGLAGVSMFNTGTQPLRDLLRSDNYINEVSPDMQPHYSFYLSLSGTIIMILAGVPFWQTIPYDDGTAEGGAVQDALMKARAIRVKNYLDDRTNTTYEEEVFTEAPDPRMKQVSMRAPRTQPREAKPGSPMRNNSDFAMQRPGSPLSVPASPGVAQSPSAPSVSIAPVGTSGNGSPPGSPATLSPGSPAPGSPNLQGSPPPLPGSPEETPRPVIPSRAVPPPLPFGEPVKTKVERINAPKLAGRDGEEDSAEQADVVIRKRPVTRCPQFKDMAFKRSLPVGSTPDGLLNNYHVEVEVTVKEKGPNVTIGKG